VTRYEPVTGPAVHRCVAMTVRPLIYGYLRVWTMKAILEHIAGARVWTIRP